MEIKAERRVHKNENIREKHRFISGVSKTKHKNFIAVSGRFPDDGSFHSFFSGMQSGTDLYNLQ